MNIASPTLGNSLNIEAFVKTTSTRIVGMALGYCICEKIAQILNAKFSASHTAHLPYAGLIVGVLITRKALIIHAIALLILIPLQGLLFKEKVSKKPSFVEDMQVTVGLEDQHYILLEKETKQIAAFINNLEKSNVLILGPAGSGKTALIESIVQRVCKEDETLHKGLIDKKFYRVSCVDVMRGTTYRGALEEKIEQILKFAESQKKSVIIFDEIHQLALANRCNQGSNSISVLDFFKANLARSGISIIGMTTNKEFHTHLNDAALIRRFNLIHITAPSFEESLKMLKERTKGLLKKYPNIPITDHNIYKQILDFVQKKPYQNSSLIDQAYNILQTAFTVVSFENDAGFQKCIDKKSIQEICKNYFDKKSKNSISNENDLD
ncbi:MAG: AAA family ATPase [Candidatus Rhabdochlamydia sp.]